MLITRIVVDIHNNFYALSSDDLGAPLVSKSFESAKEEASKLQVPDFTYMLFPDYNAIFYVSIEIT